MKKISLFCSFALIFTALLITGCRTTQDGAEEKVYKRYYPDGILQSVWVVENGKLNGIKRVYSRNGTLKNATEYKDDKINGMNNVYYEDGVLWRKEIYKDGKMVSRVEFDEEGYSKNEESFESK